MKETLTYKILNAHKVSEDLENNKMSIKIDQTLTQDATGTMAYLEFISFGLDKVRTDLSVSYVDPTTHEAINGTIKYGKMYPINTFP